MDYSAARCHVLFFDRRYNFGNVYNSILSLVATCYLSLFSFIYSWNQTFDIGIPAVDSKHLRCTIVCMSFKYL